MTAGGVSRSGSFHLSSPLLGAIFVFPFLRCLGVAEWDC